MVGDIMTIMNGLTIRTKIGEGGRVVIPAPIRRAIGVEVGDHVTLSVNNNTVQITTSKEALKRLQALVRQKVPRGVSIVDELIRDRREEVEREERDKAANE